MARWHDSGVPQRSISSWQWRQEAAGRLKQAVYSGKSSIPSSPFDPCKAQILTLSTPRTMVNQIVDLSCVTASLIPVPQPRSSYIEKLHLWNHEALGDIYIQAIVQKFLWYNYTCPEYFIRRTKDIKLWWYIHSHVGSRTSHNGYSEKSLAVHQQIYR